MRFNRLALGVLMIATTLRAEVRQPAVADSFYPGDRHELEQQLAEYFRGVPADAARPLAVIVPHAGYVFSGATAGKAFAALRGAKVTRVILLGPSHHSGFRGAALPPARVTAFATPLGEMPVDTVAVEALRGSGSFAGPGEAHAPEHSLEVELPFLQATVGNVPIVPILIGYATSQGSAEAIAHALAPLLAEGTIVVVSSDFTHHGPSYDFAPFPRDQRLGAILVDLARATAGRAAALDARGFEQQVEVSGDTVCGARPIEVLLALLQHAFKGTGRVVDVTDSGESSGNWNQTVAYASVSFTGAWTPWHESAPPPALGTLDEAEKKAALSLARATIDTYLNHGPALARWFADRPVTGNLAAPAGVFVTLNNTGAEARRSGRLRGCIGMMEAHEPLADAIVHNAVSVTHDPRFPAFSAGELPGIEIEISVLSALKVVPSPDAIVLGTHGVVLSKGGYRAVFLPQVATETGWDVATFLSQLSLKAGMSADAWRSGATFEVFTAQVFGEH
jgi:MEMO1 family protein